MSLTSMAVGALVYNTANTIGGFVNSVLNAPPGSAASYAGGEQIKYPMDLPENYNINFQFVKYQRRSIFEQPSFPRVGGVQLPIPVNLLDSQSIEWASTQTDPIIGAAIENGLQDYQQGNASLGSIVKQAGTGALAGGAVDLAAKAVNG